MNVELKGVEKTYNLSEGICVSALRGVNVHIAPGDFVALVGPSGCGKTTLLSIIGLLTWPTAGSYLLEGKNVRAFSRREQARWRAGSIGFIFQSYNLLPREKVWRNVMLPLTFDKRHRGSRKQRSLEALEAVGLLHRAEHYPTQISGGEQQRVAIARALVNHPKLLIADEPTGNLDSRTGNEILALITRVAETYGSSIVMATHDKFVAGHAKRLIEMKDGGVISDTPGK